MNPHLPGASLSFAAYITVSGDDQADASLGEHCHHPDKPARANSLSAGHTLPGGRTNKPICQVHAVDNRCFEKDRHKHFSHAQGLSGGRQDDTPKPR